MKIEIGRQDVTPLKMVASTVMYLFFYFTDVCPDGGGVVMLPGSHKSEFEHPLGIQKSYNEPDGICFQNLGDPNHPLHPTWLMSHLRLVMLLFFPN